jgi:hypothetical protein
MATLTWTRGSGLDFLDEEVRGSDTEAVSCLVDLGGGRSGCTSTSMVHRLFVVPGEKGNREKRAAADAEGRAARVRVCRATENLRRRIDAWWPSHRGYSDVAPFGFLPYRRRKSTREWQWGLMGSRV